MKPIVIAPRREKENIRDKGQTVQLCLHIPNDLYAFIKQNTIGSQTNVYTKLLVYAIEKLKENGETL